MSEIQQTTEKIASLDLEIQPEAGPSKRTAAQKWHNPDGPPVGSNFGARRLDEDQDVWSHNAWSACKYRSAKKA
jgi:hypothetical protein